MSETPQPSPPSPPSGADPAVVVEFRKVTKTYAAGTPGAFTAIQDVNFVVRNRRLTTTLTTRITIKVPAVRAANPNLRRKLRRQLRRSFSRLLDQAYDEVYDQGSSSTRSQS